ncbi:hypothetical protein OG589_15810 [Sphaerisporangium sp. NBC_01403]
MTLHRRSWLCQCGRSVRYGNEVYHRTGSEDRTVRVWDLAARKQIGAPLTGHTDCVWTVAFGRLGSRSVAVTGSRDETVREWNLGPPYPS